MKLKRWLWLIPCIGALFIGIFVGRLLSIFPIDMTISSKAHTNSILTLNVPQIPIPSDWAKKENLPGNSFKSAFSLNTGINTQGTLNENNVIDYYFFILQNPSQVVVNVTNIPKALYWVLYDSDFHEVSSTYRTGASEGSTQIALQNPGKYYVKVWADYHQTTNYPYTIRLNVLPYFD